VSFSSENHIRVGSDICSVSRILRVYEKYGARFLDKILTETEKKYVLSKLSKGSPGKTQRVVEAIAGRFAAKEAIAKALGTGWRGIHWHDVEVINAESGAPHAVLHGRAAERLAGLGCHHAEISLSHEREYALATALLY
jgi:holo-[acyl-carrier protein] synthase